MDVREPGARYLPETGARRPCTSAAPSNWDLVALSDIAERIMVGIASAATHAYRARGVVMFRNQNIKPGYLDDSDVLYIAEDYEAAFKNKRLKADDLLTARTGYPGTTSVVPTQYSGAQSFTTLITRPKRECVDPRYLCHYINSDAGQRYFEQAQIGGGQKNVNAAALRLLPVSLPPTLGEQEAIAEVLSDIDVLIESLEQLLAKKRHIKQGAMQELLTGKRRLPGFGGEWKEMRLGELFSFSGGHSASRDQLGANGHCYLHYGDIHTGTKTHIDLTLEREDIPKLDVALRDINATALLEDGDIVFVDASEDDEGASRHVVIKNPERLPFIAGLHTIVAKVRTDELVPLYRRHCFQTAAVKAQFRFFAVGTKVLGVSKSNIVKIAVPVPPSIEQTAIAAILSDMDTEITDLEARLAKARALKQGMAQALLTARIRLV